MLTDTQAGKSLINDVAYRIVSEQAPEELPLYVSTRDRYFADPARFNARADTIDRELGLGAGEIVQTLTATVFPILTPILVYLVGEAARAIQGEAAKQAVEWVRTLFARPQPLFSQDELTAIVREITAIADTEAERLALDRAQVQAIKDTLIARLALAKR